MKVRKILLLAFMGLGLLHILPLLVGMEDESGCVWAEPFFIEGRVLGDINGDLKVNMTDYALMSQHFGATDCNAPLWCNNADQDRNGIVELNDVMTVNWLAPFPTFASFAHHYPTRLAMVSEELIGISDAQAGSVSLYNSALEMVGEISGLDLPMGVASDGTGKIYVGNDGRDNVEVYDHSGVLLSTIGNGEILMPLDLCLDQQNNLYVADSLGDAVKVYDPNGLWLFDIGQTGSGEGKFKFPSAVAITYSNDPNGNLAAELFVADQNNYRIQVFDSAGNFKRALGGILQMGGTDWRSWKGRFIKIQSLDFDAAGRLHVVDYYMNKVQVLRADTGFYHNSYGAYGVTSGSLNLPLDLLITPAGQILVACAENQAVEVFVAAPQ